MGVDEDGTHREGKDGSDETEIRVDHVCDRCLTKTTCAMWENHAIDHDDGEVSSFSYLCLNCLHRAVTALTRFIKPRPHLYKDDVKKTVEEMFSNLSLENSMRGLLNTIQQRSKYGGFTEVIPPFDLAEERQMLEGLIKSTEESGSDPQGMKTRREMLKNVALGHLELAEAFDKQGNRLSAWQALKDMHHAIDVADSAIGLPVPGIRNPDTDLFGWLADAQPRSRPVGLAFYLDHIKHLRTSHSEQHP